MLELLKKIKKKGNISNKIEEKSMNFLYTIPFMKKGKRIRLFSLPRRIKRNSP